MSKKLIATISLVFALATLGFSAMPAAAASASAGACNLIHTNSTGFEGMLKASDQGLGNMIDLVLASEAAGCSL